MNLSILKILLVLSAVGVVYLFTSNDDPVEPKEVKYQERNTKPAVSPNAETGRTRLQSGHYSEALVFPPTFSNDYGQSPKMGREWDSQFSQPRFRPLERSGNETGGYQPDMQQFPQDIPAFSYGPRAYDNPDYRNQGGQGLPHAMLERFRPWDEKRQSKRWHGNYQRMTTWPEQLVAPDRSSFLRLAGPD